MSGRPGRPATPRPILRPALPDEIAVCWLDFLPPTDNRLTAMTRKGMRFRTAEYTEFRAEIARMWAGLKLPTFGADDLVLDLDVVWPAHPALRRDPNNRMKGLCDALEAAGVMDDDKQVLGRVRSQATEGFPEGAHPYAGAGIRSRPGILITLRRARLIRSMLVAGVLMTFTRPIAVAERA